MTFTITMPHEIEDKLQRKAAQERLSVEQLIVQLLAGILAEDEQGEEARLFTLASPEEVVARIKATPPNPHSLRPAQGSLADALRDSPLDPTFDLSHGKKHGMW
jgi:hypothetical protein